MRIVLPVWYFARMRVRLRVSATTVMAIMAGALPAVLATPAFATTAPVGTGVCGDAKVRPGLISLATDGDAFLAGYRAPGHLPYSDGARVPSLHWAEWTTSDARASGWEWLDTDYPSVGGGTYYAFRASVHLYRPRAGVFTRMTIAAQIPKAFIERWHGDWSDHETLSASSCSSGGIGWN
jgi:hypothetical protein